MTIYTRRGDEGQTDLGDGRRVSKASSRIESYGTVDEVNAHIGVARPSGYDDVDDYLATIQNHLHIIQARLAAPEADGPIVTDNQVSQLEEWIDNCEAELDPLRWFVLPGGSEVGARLHVSRTVCRRAERRVVALAADEAVDEPVLAYLNRLSDALFVFARLVNAREGIQEERPTY